MGKVIVVVGVQAGDEAKGRVCAHLMDEADICCRYSGANNTGATVYASSGQKYKFHHLPVSIAANKPSYIGAACLIDPRRLLEEINLYKSYGFDVDSNLRISPDCHVITEAHIQRDSANEDAGKGVGSTKRGVSPCSMDKYARKGVKLETLGEFDRYFANVPQELNRAIDQDKSVVFEGSQGYALDIDQGNYPYVSTTTNVSGGACSSCGVGPTRITEVVGVTKCYSTYVGTGPYTTEVQDQALNECIADRGHEYGTTTNRRRRVGFLDLPALKQACLVNGCTSLALTKSDVLKGLTMKYCVGYELDGTQLDSMPVKRSDYNRCIPIYQEIQVRTGREFIPIVEQAVGIPVKYFSFGAERNALEEL